MHLQKSLAGYTSYADAKLPAVHKFTGGCRFRNVTQRATCKGKKKAGGGENDYSGKGSVR